MGLAVSESKIYPSRFDPILSDRFYKLRSARQFFCRAAVFRVSAGCSLTEESFFDKI